MNTNRKFQLISGVLVLFAVVIAWGSYVICDLESYIDEVSLRPAFMVVEYIDEDEYKVDTASLSK